MYIAGEGVEKNLSKAFELFEKSANQGNANAQYNLGLMYEKGEGVKQDLQKAFYWYEKSANQGFEEAQQILKEFRQK